MKRLVAGALLLILASAVGYGYVVSRRERTYRVLISRGETALARHDTSTAITAFSSAIAIKADSMLGYLKRGEARRRHNELDAALEDFRRAAEIDPLAPRPLELLGDVTYALARAPRHAVPDDKARFERAASHYQACIELDDRSPRVLYKLALARYSAGEAEAAVTALNKAVAIDDAFADAYYLLGLCYSQLHKRDSALRALERAVKLAPAMLHAREELAELYEGLNRNDERIQQLDALRALDPGPTREVALGLAYAKAGEPQSAVVTLGRAAERHPDHPDTYVTLGRLWFEKAQSSHDRVDLNKALGALERAVTNTHSSEALTLYARALVLAHDDEAAERALLRAVETFPIDPLAFLLLADAAERRGHAGAAQWALLDFYALEGEDRDRRRASTFALRVADLSMRSADAPAAVTWYQRAAALADDDPALLVRLAEAQLAAGDRDGARLTVARVLQKDPGHPPALALQRRLR